MARPFDKYRYYSRAVQEPGFDLDFLNEKFRQLRGRQPLSFREDFCGAALLATEWVKQGPRRTAIGIDLDAETIAYGKKHYVSKLSPSQQRRFDFEHKDVTHCSHLKADIVGAFNFSYWIFRERSELLRYFRNVRRAMKKDSIFFLDTSGGYEVVKEHTERKKMRGFVYYWECQSFNPISHECRFAIHIKPQNRRIYKNLFTYHWRYWTLPELKDLLLEAGFSQVMIYMEGDDGKGGGNGEFEIVKEAEECQVWVAYIAALP